MVQGMHEAYRATSQAYIMRDSVVQRYIPAISMVPDLV